MNYKFLIVLSILLLSGFASASHYYNDDVDYKETISKTYYNSDYDYAVTRTIYASYDNDDRYSTYDYRHGYSYRESEKYWNDHHDFDRDYKVIKKADKKKNYRYERDDDDYRLVRHERRYYDYDDYYYGHNSRFGSWRYADENPRIQARYVAYLDDYEYRECYDYTPRNKLFYVRC